MRPDILSPLFGRVAALPGVGPKTAPLFDRLLARPGAAREARVVDLLFHLPSGVIDRSQRPTIAEAPLETIVVIKARVAEHRRPQGRYAKQPYRVLVEDETGDVELVFFLANADWIERSLPLGETRWISGRIELYDGRRQMVHPDRVLDAAGLAKLAPFEPVYGLTEGLQPRFVLRATEEALARIPALPEWQDASVLAANRLPGFAESLRAAHRPENASVLAPQHPARQRLALDELLASQLALRLVRAKMRRLPGRESKGDGRIARVIEAALPFRLTGAQQRALADIRADLASDRRMLRLVQGDVGSGKTVVAALAMASVVECGRQAALMAPTEILARQHYDRLAPLLAPADVRMALLTGASGKASAWRPMRRSRPARWTSWSARMRWRRRTSLSAIWASPSWTNSIVSACNSGWRSAPRARRRMCS